MTDGPGIADEVLVRLEEQGWDALTTDDGAAFYETLLTEGATMLFPGTGLLDRDAILEAMRSAPPWRRYRIEGVSVHHVGEGAALLTYRATAQREGQSPYEAYVSSLYVQQDRAWKLAFHQHTPDPSDPS